MTLFDSISRYRADIAAVNQLIAKAYAVDAGGLDLFDRDGKDFVVSSAFLRMFIAWETFLENAFSKYLVGELSTDGTVVQKYVSPVDRNHALKILIGTQKYVDWANAEIVRRLAKLYLENGGPIDTNLASVMSELTDLKTIRNAAAHLSSTTQPPLDALASRILKTTVANINVATLVTSMHPDNPAITVLLHYQNILDGAAQNIAANRV